MMGKRLLLTALILVFCTAALFGCAEGTQEAKGEIRKGESVSGGDAALQENVNLKDMAVEQQGEDTVITMSFLSGSRNEGVSESKLSSVPEYRVKLLNDPVRMQVDLNIDYSDYASQSEWFAGSSIYGTFKTVFTGSVSVYFQLNEDVRAAVSEEEDRLIIRLTPAPEPVKTLYYAGINAYEEFSQNLIPPELGLTPTMCEGLSDIMMISEPFTDAETAQQRAQSIEEKMKEAAPSKKARVFELDTNQLPGFAQDQKPEEPAEAVTSVLMLDGAALPMETLVENGKYLSTTPQGGILFARSYVPSTEEDREQVVKERLWMRDPSGKMTQFDLPDFYDVQKAETSPDGQYLGILDAGLESNVLYVLDTETGTLHNLGEEGFGDETTSFVWDGAEPVIYAMTGAGTLQLTKYDFGAEEGSRISSVEEMPGAESKIQLVGDLIYFADKDAALDEEQGVRGVVYAVNKNTGVRSTVGEGVVFTVAPDGSCMAALVPLPVDDQQESMSLQITGLMAESEPIQVPDSTFVESYAFSADGDTLYYTTREYEGVTEEYPIALLKYNLSTGQETLLAYSKTGRFVPGKGTGELYIIDYNIQDFNNFYTTYVYTDS